MPRLCGRSGRDSEWTQTGRSKREGDTDMDGHAKEINLAQGFGDVAVKANGATVEVHADGSVAARTYGDVDVYTSASVPVHAISNDGGRAVAAEPTPGDRMPDGTIYAGVSPDNGQED